jgi:magnesium-transporting ATPase (P-type)
MDSDQQVSSRKDWHALSADATMAALGSFANGLDDREAESRLRRYGPNLLPRAPRRGAAARFLRQFDNVLIYVLLICAVVTTLLQEWLDTLVILGVVIANAIIGFIQEGKAEVAMEGIHRMLAPQASVLRNGNRRSIPADALVPGDIVLLEAGDKVPADLRLLETQMFSTQEAILTGESAAVNKNPGLVTSEQGPGDRTNMAFAGTFVAAGQGRGIVVGTGFDTELGRIVGLLAGVEQLTTPLVEQMAMFARWLTVLIVLLSVVLLSYGFFVSHLPFTELFMAVVSLAVSAIPEGLPAVLTITLAIGARAMARRNAIVRRLPAIETIGSVSVICTDKTGTLTRNEMIVATLIGAQCSLDVEGCGYDTLGAIRLNSCAITSSERATLNELAMSFALCSDATLQQHEGMWKVNGDPMEGALLACAEKLGSGVQALRAAWPRTDAIPFDPANAWMATLHHDHDGHAFIFLKGAPERVLSMCASQRMPNGADAPIDHAHWHGAVKDVATQGQRVLAFAVRPVSPEHTILEHSDVQGGMILLGMVGIADPPRAEARTAIAECVRAGIQVKMITGDHAETAAAIARHIGLRHLGRVLSGNDIDRMDDAALRGAVLDCDVFARTSPKHKLRLVMALQANGLTVAMTGDGVNDAPALKRADVGIAMGQKGSDAAREAAELVLADDNFASIVAAVREGRTVYDNIKKVISWMLPTNAGEALIITAALLLGWALPVSPIQILWINLVTEGTLGLALAFEPTEVSTMSRAPRPRGQGLLSGALVWHVVLVSLLFLWGAYGIYAYALERGYSLELARTLALNTIVVMEIAHLFFIRNIYGTSLTWRAAMGTPAVWITVGILVLAQLAVTYLPLLQATFGTAPVPFLDGLLVLGIGVALFVIIEAEKQIRLRL